MLSSQLAVSIVHARRVVRAFYRKHRDNSPALRSSVPPRRLKNIGSNIVGIVADIRSACGFDLVQEELEALITSQKMPSADKDRVRQILLLSTDKGPTLPT